MTDTEISRYMALLLRHKPEIAGLVLDKQGWADVDMLLKCISENMEPVSFERLCEIVKNDSKQRYSFNEDKSRIRANQGHSVNVDVGLKAAVPPEYLYHGTATRFVESIDSGGIIRKTRLYVHLSQDTETATQVGKRHGKPFIYRVTVSYTHLDVYKRQTGTSADRTDCNNAVFRDSVKTIPNHYPF